MLAGLPAHRLARYEQKFGGLARAKFLAAQKANDRRAIREISEQ
jgi:hypothetical protein